MNHDEIEELISADRLQACVEEMGREITRDFADAELHVIGVLKGSFVFMADLLREIDLEASTDFLGLSSYGNSRKSSGVVRMDQDLTMPIEGKDVLIVEDIVDTGLTMSYLLDNLRTRKPASMHVCTLLTKPSNMEADIPIDYQGFEVPDRFVIGYGLDYAEYYRNLPYIGALTSQETADAQ